MEAFTSQFAADATQGRLVRGGATLPLLRVSTDSRAVRPGDLFVALKGDKFDGHDFLEQVIAQGAGAVMVQANRLPNECGGAAVIAVEDPRVALGRLGAAYRARFTPAMIAVGGSNGKTTTKELIAGVLARAFSVLKSEASFNNEIGVPLTLLNLEKSHQTAVLEVGTNHPGELKPLLEQVQPNFGVITSIGREHLEYFGSLEGVADEEGMVASLLPSNGCLFINAEIPFLESILSRTSANQVLVGRHPKSQWNPVKIKLDAAGVEFEVEAADARYSGSYRVNLVGRHQVTNALLALAVGARLGMPKEALAAGLLSCQAVKLRMNVTDLAGVRILDDCYNANADSMRAALETLVELPCAGRRVALLGDMAELGLHCREAHQEVGRRAAELGVNWLMGVGSMSQVMVDAAHRAGMPEAKAFLAVEEAAKALKNFVRPGDMVLIKASRVMRLERISDLLQGRKN